MIKKKNSNIYATLLGGFMLWISITLLEQLLRILDGLSYPFDGFGGNCLFSLAIASVITVLCVFMPGHGDKKGRILSAVILEIITIWFILGFFLDDSYKVFMPPSLIFLEAKNVIFEFSDNVGNVFKFGIWHILIFHIPLLIYILVSLFGVNFDSKKSIAAPLLITVFILSSLGSSIVFNSTDSIKSKYKDEYTYDDSVRAFGLLPSLYLECKYSITGDTSSFQYESNSQISTPENYTVEISNESNVSDENDESNDIAEPVKDYGFNVMDIDFDTISANNNRSIKALNDYVQSLTPSNKNEYTGLFEGKNLILITAEALSLQVVDEERTPTLYRLMTKGIYFEDFYQPVWGGSTSTGEYSFLSGLVPMSPTVLSGATKTSYYLTMGNQLQRLGYFSAAYHNGQYTYYNRNLTHTRLGYDTFTAMGNGMEKGVSATNTPESDLEMMEYTFDQYKDQQPFSIYYMSISGHASYAFDSNVNDMSVKNESVTEGMEHSDAVRAYFACQQELEYALEYMINALEEEGIADDTVIAIVPDHYPYGLAKSAAWGNSASGLDELIGGSSSDQLLLTKTVGIIWSGSLEKLEEPIVISEPTYSLDILPTLSNLFGVEYDSRLLVGRDVFSDQDALVIFKDYCWLTEKGYYDSHKHEFYPSDNSEVDEQYVSEMCETVSNKMTYSQNVPNLNYFKVLFGS